MTKSLLVVEDDDAMREMLELGLRRRGYEATTKRGAIDALHALETEEIEVVLTDLNMPGMSGVALCQRLAEARPELPVIVITAFGSMESAIAAIRAGAYDFVTKPIDLDDLALTLERAFVHRRLRDELRRLRRTTAAGADLGDVVGESPALRKAYQLIDRVADSEASVLITGESGTGKEAAARALHHRSKRGQGPFIALNCAAMPEHLLESELFGHVRGAFTDAKANKAGLFVEANGGTLFLDEVGELPPGLQPKLLRALQERSVRPVGATAEVSFSARIVAATNRDLDAAVDDGSFRSDLLFRLNVIGVELPPLRARGHDVVVLAHRFIAGAAERAGKAVCGFSPDFASKLLAYPWPGNVRELQNCIERAVAVTAFSQLGVDDLSEKIRNYRPGPLSAEGAELDALVTLGEVERNYILRVLEAHGGNRTLAARTLGLDRKTLYRKLESYRVLPDKP